MNGNREFIEDATTLLQLLLSRNIDPDTVVVEHNLAIVERDDFPGVFIRDKDVIEILRFVGGG